MDKTGFGGYGGAMTEGTCRLCRRHRALARSHILPQFVGDWIKRTSVTGRLRLSDAPNRPVQDTAWRHWLCEECEARFSLDESEVNSRVFGPLHEEQVDRYRYGPAFYRFCVSVCWRVLHLLVEEDHLGGCDRFDNQMRRADDVWRAYLHGERRDAGAYDFHALPLDRVVAGDIGEAGAALNRFILRSIGMRPVCTDTHCAVVAKMARLLVIGTIVDPHRGEWHGTKLHREGGGWGQRDYRAPAWVKVYLRTGSERLRQILDTLSDRQKQGTVDRLTQAIASDPNAVANSGSFDAMAADVDMFGDDAFEQK